MVPSASGEPSPTRILLHKYRGLCGSTFFRKLLLSSIFCTEFASTFQEMTCFGASNFGIYVCYLVGMHFTSSLTPFGLPFGAVCRSLALLASFGSLLVVFWFLAFRLCVAPSRCRFAQLCSSGTLSVRFGHPQAPFWNTFGVN